MSRNKIKVQRMLEDAATHHRAGKLTQAESQYRQVLAAQPLHTEALHLLGVLTHQRGEHAAAVKLILQAIRLDPENPVSHLNLGEAYRALKDRDNACASYEQALALRPDYAAAHNNLGLLWQDSGQLERAREHYEHALALESDLAEPRNNLARLLMNMGRIKEAIVHYRKAAESRPGDSRMHSNLIFALQHDPGAGTASLNAEYRRWNEQRAVPLGASVRPHSNSVDPSRRLKIGYVSADFRQHPVSFFFYPLLRAHDAHEVEVYAYSCVKRPDTITEGMRKLAAVWRNVSASSDAELAGQIRADGIDILVDMTMHAANSRLLVCARRPAPVQVNWLAYPGTTGLEAIDYRLSDSRMDPPDTGAELLLGGEPCRLPDSWCCYHPLAETPAVEELPAMQNRGLVTFGCLNNFNKVNRAVLAHWAAVLAAVPGSRLLLHCPAEESIHRRVRAVMAETGGVAGERLEFVSRLNRMPYLRTYGRIDIGLDPFPFNGMTTTCEALWMGVPVLALRGPTPGARVGASLLATLGLDPLVADSPAEQVKIAAALARDLSWVAHLRGTLRPRMQASPLMNAPRFARNVEKAYRTMWQRWCGEHTKQSPVA